MTKEERAERDIGSKRFNYELRRRGPDGFVNWQKELAAKKCEVNESDRQQRLKASIDEFNHESGRISVGTYRVSQAHWDRIFKKE